MKDRPKMQPYNPAAVAAFAQGDIDNFLVAATPGGIEAQEKAGQAMLVASELLPKELSNCTRDQLMAIGFKFGDDHDELFVKVELPKGWSKQATDHDMHSNLLDEKGRVRAGIFYKAAFYDRRADMRMRARHSVRVRYPDSSQKSEYWLNDAALPEGQQDVELLGSAESYAGGDKVHKAAQERLAFLYPDHRNVFAYWDEP